jgi:hypothetical protein
VEWVTVTGAAAMKSQLLVSDYRAARELSQLHDFSAQQMKELALRELGHFYETSGDKIVPKPHIAKPVPYAVQVQTGQNIKCWTIGDLAKSLGKPAP